MSWSWRKLLMIRPLIHRYMWFQLGDGRTASAWFDNWDAAGPLIDMLTPRRIANAGFTLSSKVVDIILNGDWKWPPDWSDQMHHIQVPLLSNDKDLCMWKDRNGVLHQFSVSVAWEDLRPRANPVSWFNIVWFPGRIPKHAFILWLVFRRKLKTQDLLQPWDINGSSTLSCPLCSSQPDSHEHLFFACPYSMQVWSYVKLKASLGTVGSNWNDIVLAFLSFAHKRSFKSEVSKLLLATSVYFIWKERNARLFKDKRLMPHQLSEAILASTRLKLMSFRYRRKSKIESWMEEWRLPSNLMVDL